MAAKKRTIEELKQQARDEYVAGLMRQFSETGNPMRAVEALLIASDHKATAPAHEWLRAALARILGLAYGDKAKRRGTIESAIGISKKHIREAGIAWRDDYIRQQVAGRDKRKQTRGQAEAEVAAQFGLGIDTARRIAGTKRKR